jgi:hypothetical protein
MLRLLLGTPTGGGETRMTSLISRARRVNLKIGGKKD